MNIGIRITLGNSDPGTGMTGLHVYANYIHDFDDNNVNYYSWRYNHIYTRDDLYNINNFTSTNYNDNNYFYNNINVAT